MDHSPKKKSQKQILIKLKSWTKKLVASPKNDSSLNNNQSEWNDAAPQLTHPSLDDSGIVSRRSRSESLTRNIFSNALNNDNIKTSTMLSTIEERNTSTFNMFSNTSVKATKDKINSSTTKSSSRRNSFFGIPRLNSRLSSRVSSTTM